MKQMLNRLSELKSRLTPDEMRVVQDLLSDQDAEWQKKFQRIPILAPLLGSFGLVATFYGFEKILDRTFLVEQPVMMLAIGIGLLLFTGVFYRKL